MAKGLRSKSRKTNNQKLRSRVFEPVEQARKDRLSKKLVDLASPPQQRELEEAQARERTAVDHGQATEADQAQHDTGRSQAKSQTGAKIFKRDKVAYRVHKKGQMRRKSSIVFPVYRKGSRVARGT